MKNTANSEKESKKIKKSPKEESFLGVYHYAVGRRKTAVAQVRIYPDGNDSEHRITVNNREMKKHFPTAVLQDILTAPLRVTGSENKFGISVLVRGGGITGQAGAVQLGVARALVKYDEELKKPLRDNGYLTRDSRMVERKKPGLNKARRAPQWSKR